MDYKFTFEDGSSAYLAHHGIKGMRWGVHNDETKVKYGELRGADRSAAYGRGEDYSRKQGSAFVKREKLRSKAASAKESGNLKRYAKLSKKAEKADYKYEREREFKNWGKSGLTDEQRTRAAVGQLARGYVKGNTGLGLMGSSMAMASALAFASPAAGAAVGVGMLAVGGLMAGSGVKNTYRAVRTSTAKKPTVDVNIKK